MKTACAVVIAFVLASLAFAQSPSKILKQAEKAMGGSKLLLGVRSLQMKGRVTRLRDQARGSYSLITQRPALINERFDLNGFEIETGFNGRSAWSRNSRDGLQTLTGDESLVLQTAAAFRSSLWLNAKQERSKLVSSGQIEINGKTMNAVTLTTVQSVTVKMFFDATTGLMARTVISKGSAARSCDYGGYRDVGGVKIAFSNRIGSDEDVFEVKLSEVKRDQATARSDFDLPSLSGEPLPDLTKLLLDVQANEDRIEALLDTYSYVQKSISRELGKDGVLREKGSETYQLSFYKGYRIRRLIEKNGQPLSASEQANEDKTAAKRVAEIEKELAESERKTAADPPSSEGRSVSIAEVLRASKLTNPRRERFRERNVIVFDFEPDPDFDYKNAKSMLKFFGKTAGVIWIDEIDKQVARVDAFLVDSFNVGGGVLAKLKKGATFTLEQARINDEIWLPSRADINLSVRVLLVKGIDLNQVILSYDYHKFSTEVKDAAVNDIVKP
jgi:hypothetical protein